jgi:hypothetical protein
MNRHLCIPNIGKAGGQAAKSVWIIWANFPAHMRTKCLSGLYWHAWFFRTYVLVNTNLKMQSCRKHRWILRKIDVEKFFRAA